MYTFFKSIGVDMDEKGGYLKIFLGAIVVSFVFNALKDLLTYLVG